MGRREKWAVLEYPQVLHSVEHPHLQNKDILKLPKVLNGKTWICHTGNYVHSIYIVLVIISNLEVIENTREDVHRLSSNTVPFYIGDLSISRFWYHRGSWNWSPAYIPKDICMQRGGATEGWSQMAEGLEYQIHLQMRKPRPREIWLSSFCPFLSYVSETASANIFSAVNNKENEWLD